MGESGEYMFIGQYDFSLDEKNRLFVPASFKLRKSEKLFITCGLEKCLFMYTRQGWEAVTEKFKNLSFTKTDARQFMRLFYSGATDTNLDSQGRVLLPVNLCKYAKLKKEAIIIGVQDRAEIWSKPVWEKYQLKAQEKYTQVAEKLII